MLLRAGGATASPAREGTATAVGMMRTVSAPEADDFERLIEEAVAALPRDLRSRVANVELAVEEEPPPGMRLLGLYEGIPLTRRGGGYGAPLYSGALPDKITIYRGPLVRLSGADPARLAAEVRHVVWHELAHHFGISDERLIELDRY
jgi:predicted Zn-dependent protease with MMP-like domain